MRAVPPEHDREVERSERALLVACAEMYFQGVSTRNVRPFDSAQGEARGLAGVKYIVSDAHSGIRAAIGRHLQGAQWQRCRVHPDRSPRASGRSGERCRTRS